MLDDPHDTRHWPHYFERLTQTGRAHIIELNGVPCWAAAERLPYIAVLGRDFSTLETETVTQEAAIKQLVQGWLQITGPITSTTFAERLGLDPAAIFHALLAMEMQGLAMRGVFERPAPAPSSDSGPSEVKHPDHAIEWCERRILQRIHRLTLATARKQVEAVAPAVYMRWLMGWQHLAPQTQLAGEEGVLEALRQLEGFEAPAIEWERTLLPARVANYDPRWLDALCLSGAVGWGRISPHPAWAMGDGNAPRRVIPTNAAPITFYIRESANWLAYALAQQSVDEKLLAAALSPEAVQIRALLAQRGACFAADLQRTTGLTRQQTAHALWELATAGVAAADGFDQLRALMDPRRKSSAPETSSKRPSRTNAGRWSLLIEPTNSAAPSMTAPLSRVGSNEARAAAQSAAIQRAKETDAALESFARQLLARYGVLFRDLLTRESNAPKWRDLLGILRRLEARGEVRGGRFVTGFGGEQFALPEAVESLRLTRNRTSEEEIAVAAADPLNLAGIVIPGERVPAVPGKEVRYSNGVLVIEEGQPQADATPTQAALPSPAAKRRRFLPPAPLPMQPTPAPTAPTLF
jgi:ATP-dependent Lhr-like helicase